MAGKKGWGKNRKDPEPTPAEVPASDGLEHWAPQPEQAGTMMEQTQQDTIPSCMNGCPHFFAVSQDGAKYLGLCRRFPPVPLSDADLRPGGACPGSSLSVLHGDRQARRGGLSAERSLELVNLHHALDLADSGRTV